MPSPPTRPVVSPPAPPTVIPVRPTARITARAFDLPSPSPATAPPRPPVVFIRPPRRVVDPEPQEPPTSPPHLAAAIDFSPFPCPSAATVSAITTALGQVLAPMTSGLDVMTRCHAPTNRFSIAVWLSPPPNQRERDARTRGFEQLGLLEPGEKLGLFLNTSLIRQLAATAFAAMPKRFSNHGVPSSNGPINLTALRFEMQGPDKIVTRVEGFTEQTWPDIDFTLSITDTLSTATRNVACGSSTVTLGWLRCRTASDLDLDDSDVLGAVAAAIFTLPVGVGVHFLGELIDAAGAGGGSSVAGTGGGIGCQVANLVQTPIPLPGRSAAGGNGLQIVPSYSRRRVTAGGLFLGGSWTACLRTARLAIRGPGAFVVPLEDPEVSGIYRAEGIETQGDINVTWSVEPVGGAQIASRTSPQTRITFVDGRLVGTRPLVTEFRVTATGSDGDGPLPPVTKVVNLRNSAEPLPPHTHRDGRDPSTP